MTSLWSHLCVVVAGTQWSCPFRTTAVSSSRSSPLSTCALCSATNSSPTSMTSETRPHSRMTSAATPSRSCNSCRRQNSWKEESWLRWAWLNHLSGKTKQISNITCWCLLAFDFVCSQSSILSYFPVANNHIFCKLQCFVHFSAGDIFVHFDIPDWPTRCNKLLFQSYPVHVHVLPYVRYISHVPTQHLNSEQQYSNLFLFLFTSEQEACARRSGTLWRHQWRRRRERLRHGGVRGDLPARWQEQQKCDNSFETALFFSWLKPCFSVEFVNCYAVVCIFVFVCVFSKKLWRSGVWDFVKSFPNSSASSRSGSTTSKRRKKHVRICADFPAHLTLFLSPKP